MPTSSLRESNNALEVDSQFRFKFICFALRVATSTHVSHFFRRFITFVPVYGDQLYVMLVAEWLFLTIPVVPKNNVDMIPY